MFDKQATVAELRRRLADTAPPPAAAADRVDSGGAVLPVPTPLDNLLPQGGLPRGAVVSLQPDAADPARAGTGGVTSLLYTLLAEPPGSAGARWSALVGFGDLGLAAAAELGVDLARVVSIPHPGTDVAQILSVLVDGLDVIAVFAPGGPVGPPARMRVLSARLRQRGTVLLAVGPWPGADLTLSVSTVGWSGLGPGYGRLRERELQVRLGGRRSGGGSAEVRLVLSPSRQGNVVAVRPADERAAAATGLGQVAHAG